MQGKLTIAQFTSASTAADAFVMLGFEPDYVVLISDCQGTNPDRYEWVNDAKFSNWSGTDGNDVLKTTGSTGVVTQVAAGISIHSGGTVITASNDQDYFTRQGANPTAGEVSSAGVKIVAALQANSGKNIVLAWRNDI